MKDVRTDFFAAPLVMMVEDEHRFLGFRTEGLAYRLGLELADIHLVSPEEPPSAGRTVLLVPREGDVRFQAEGDAR